MEGKKGGGRQDIDDLFREAYDQLRRLASSVRSGAGDTLNPTALVNEAYLKMAGGLSRTPESALHFRRIAARAMRQVIVEAIRKRRAARRGGGFSIVTLDEELDAIAVNGDEVLALDIALAEFAEQYPRQAQMVEYRFFGGYDVEETAALLEVSEATITRDWRIARAWLSGVLKRSV